MGAGPREIPVGEIICPEVLVGLAVISENCRGELCLIRIENPVTCKIERGNLPAAGKGIRNLVQRHPRKIRGKPRRHCLEAGASRFKAGAAAAFPHNFCTCQ